MRTARGRRRAGARLAAAASCASASRCRWRSWRGASTRATSWVSRRLALVEELPAEIQEHVRAGELAGARGDEVPGAVGARQRADAVRAGRGASAGQRPTQPRGRRALRRLARRAARRRASCVLTDAAAVPARAGEAAARPTGRDERRRSSCSDDLGALGGDRPARAPAPARRRVRGACSPAEREEVARCSAQAQRRRARRSVDRAATRRSADAGPEHAGSDPRAA